MLRIDIVAIGKDKNAWVSDGCAHYEKLLSRWARVNWTQIVPRKLAPSLSPARIRKAEAELIDAHLSDDLLIALSNSGRSVNSRRFATLLQKWQLRAGRFTLLIGGAYGLDESLLRRADVVLSLSPLTFSHQLVRLVVLEQLYRGFSILHNTDYHK